MRIANLAFLTLFAAASCDLQASSRSTAVAQPAVARPAAVAPAQKTHSENICGYSFEPVSAAEAHEFLSEVTGQWRDDLSAPVLVNDRAVVDGLLISENTVISTSLDTETNGVMEPVVQPQSISIGPVAADGFRIVQLNLPGEPSCAVYGFKLEWSETGPHLLVRGPLSPKGSQARSAAAFHAASQEYTRIFSTR